MRIFTATFAPLPRIASILNSLTFCSMPIHVAHNVGATHRDVVDLAGDARLDARPKGCARSGEFCRCRRCETTSSSSTSKLYSGPESGRGWYRSHGTVASERHECFYGVSLCSQVMIMRMRHCARFNPGRGGPSSLRVLDLD